METHSSANGGGFESWLNSYDGDNAVWIEWQGWRWHIGPSGSSEWLKYFRTARKGIEQLGDVDDSGDDTTIPVLAHCLAYFAIRGFEEKQFGCKYDPKVVKRWLLDNKDLREALFFKARELQEIKIKTREIAVKN